MYEYELKAYLEDRGADIAAFSYLGACASADFPELKYAVTIVRKLSDAVVSTITDRPGMIYFQHYRATNAKLDSLALDAVSFIERAGYNALPIAASQSTPDKKEEYRGVFPHKTAAVLSGIGFIGRNGLLITEKYGSKVRLATVLTDMPLEPLESAYTASCGSCTACRDACPAHAITGKDYAPGEGRDTVLDARKCSEHMKTYKDTGRGAVCGICMRVCPFNALKKGL